MTSSVIIACSGGIMVRDTGRHARRVSLHGRVFRDGIGDFARNFLGEGYAHDGEGQDSKGARDRDNTSGRR